MAKFVNKLDASVNLSIGGVPTSHTNDLGLYNKYFASTTIRHSGLVHRASDDKFYLYYNLEPEPNTTVNFSGAGFTQGILKLADVDSASTLRLGPTEATKIEIGRTSQLTEVQDYLSILNGLGVTGNITVSGTVDGVDLNTNDTRTNFMYDSTASGLDFKNMTAIEAQQLQNIDITTISIAQWGYLGAMNQNISTSGSPSFSQLTAANILLNINTISSTNTDGNISIIPNGSGEVLLKTDPASNLGAATKQYVDASATGLTVKDPVRAATAASLPSYTQSGSGVGATLTATVNGSINNTGIDGITNLSTSDRILIKEGTISAAHNGIYTITAVGDASNPWIFTRSTDADQDADVTQGMYTFAQEGSTLSDTAWVLTTDNPIIVDTTALTFTLFSSGGGGESNTASNIGTGGIGLFKQKTGVDLEFRNINTASSKLSVTLDGASNEIDLDVVQSNLTGLGTVTSGSLSTGFGTINTSNTITTSSTLIGGSLTIDQTNINDGTITFSGTTGNNKLIMPNTLAASLIITDGVQTFITFNSATDEVDFAVNTNITGILDVTGNIVVSGTVDGVDLAQNDTRTEYLYTTIDLKSVTLAEVQQMQNINTTTISATQWGYLGNANQSISTSSTPTFAAITIDQININDQEITFSNAVSGTNQIIFPTLQASAFLLSDGTNTYMSINTTSGNEAVVFAEDGNFTKDIIVSGTVDGVDVALNSTHTEFMYDSAASGLDLKNMTNAESQQLQNINTTTISATQWGYLGNANQDISTSSTPTFAALTIDQLSLNNSELAFSGTSTANKISLPDNIADALTIIAGGLNYIQIVSTNLSEQVNILQNLDVTGNITLSGTIDGVNISEGYGWINELYNTKDMKNLTLAEVQQMQNINTTTISATQWGYLGNANQGISTSSTPTFAALTIDQLSFNNAIITFSGATTANQLIIPDNLADAFRITDGAQNYIQIVSTTGADQIKLLQNVDITGNLTVSGTIDGVDLAQNDTRTEYMYTTIDLQSMTLSEVQQLQNIGITTIDSTQWGYIGVLDQSISTISVVNFAQLTVDQVNINAGAITFNDVTTANQLIVPTSLDDALRITDGANNYIKIVSSTPQVDILQNMNVSGNISVTGTVDGVDIVTNSTHTEFMYDSAASGLDLKNMTAAESQQLQNINATTISTTQWGYIGAADQNLTTTSTVQFDQLTLSQIGFNNAIITLSGATTANQLVIPDNLADAFRITDGAQNYIQIVSTTGADQVKLLQNVDVSGNITISGTVDGVDLATNDTHTEFMYDVTAGGLDLKNMTQIEVKQLQNIGATTISSGQWVYLGNMDQEIATTSTPTFAQLSVDQIMLNNGIVTFSGASNANKIAVPNNLAVAFKMSNVAETVDYLSVNSTTSTVNILQNMDVTGNIVISGLVDGVDLATNNTHTEFMYDSAASGLDLKNMTNAESQQLQNINTTTISATQWGYLGELDQSVITTSTPTFAQLNIDNIRIDGNDITSTDVNGNINIIPNGSGQILLSADPISNLGAATKQYVDTSSTGLDLKDACRVKTSSAFSAYTQAGSGVGATLTANANGSINNTGIDNITDLALTERVLVTTEGTTSDVHNGIYTFTAIGDASNPWVLTRATDADQTGELTSNTLVFVDEGGVGSGTSWKITTTGTIVIDTTAIVWTQFSSSGNSTDGQNVGTGVGKIFKQKSGNYLQFKSILQGTSTILSVSNGVDDVTLDVVQANITGVGILNSGSVTSGFGNMDIGTSLFTSGQITVDQLLLNNSTILFGGTTTNNLITVPSNLGDAFSITDGTQSYIRIISNTGSREVEILQNMNVVGNIVVSGTVDGVNLAEDSDKVTKMYDPSAPNLDFGNLDRVEALQLQNIDTTTISSGQWGYLGNMDQNVLTTSIVQFAQLTVDNVSINDGIITYSGTSAANRIAIPVQTSAFRITNVAGTVDYFTINSSLNIVNIPQDVNVTGNIVISGLVDGVDVALNSTHTEFMYDSAASGLDLKNMTNAESQQLQNIDLVTISNAQWGYLGAADQNLTTTSTVQFDQLTLSQIGFNNAIITLSGVTTANQLVIPDNLADAFRITDGAQNYIQIVSTTGADQVKLLQNTDVTGNLTVSGTVDGVNLSQNDTRTEYMYTTLNLGNVTAAEAAQLQTIGTTTISSSQWVYLGNMNQPIGTTDTPTFAALTIDKIAMISGTVTFSNSTGNNKIIIPQTLAAGLIISDSVLDYVIINTAATQVDIKQDLDVTGNITVSGTVDGVDVAQNDTRTEALYTDRDMKSLTLAEVQTIQNINTTTISATQWGYLGAADQGIATISAVQFASLAVDQVFIDNGVITYSGTTGNNKIIIPDNVADAFTLADGTHDFIRVVSTTGTEKINLLQDVDITGDLVVSGTVDGIDISAQNDKLTYLYESGSPNLDLGNLDRIEAAQLQNIDTTTISSVQWGYLGELDQSVTTASTPTFAQLTVDNILFDNSTITFSGANDANIIKIPDTGVAAFKIMNNSTSVTYFSINTTAPQVDILQNVDVTGNIVVSGLVDGVDVAQNDTRTEYMYTTLDFANLTTAEAAQLQNIGGTTVSSGQWVYLGDMDQSVTTTSTVQFAQTNVGQINVNSAITFLGANAINQLIVPDNLANALNITDGTQDYIQIVSSTGADQVKILQNLNVTGVITSSGDVNGVNLATNDTHTEFMYDSAASGLDLKNMTAAESQQLQNIGTVTISNAQWGYLGNANQEISTSSTPTFAQLSVDQIGLNDGNITFSGTSGNNIIKVPNAASIAIKISNVAGTVDYLSVNSTTSTVNILQNMDVAGNIVVSGTVDGVDLATNSMHTEFMYDSAASGLDLKNMTAAESQQLQNIDTVTISNAQWGYLGELDQSVLTTGTPTFAAIDVDNLNLNINTISSTNTDGDVNIIPNGSGEILLGSNPISALGAATKQYVDAVAQGLDVLEAARVKTAYALDTYTQAGSGVGATLTANSNGSINVSGIDDIKTLIAGDRVLMTTEGTTSDVHNGVYSITVVGDASNPWVLTRTTDADQAGDLNSSSFVFVNDGSDANNTGWKILTTGTIVIDTTAITWAQILGVTAVDGKNVGIGIGKIYKERNGNTLLFKSIASASTILGIANGVDDVTLNIVQANITGVGVLASGSISSAFGNIDIGTSSMVAGSLTIDQISLNNSIVTFSGATANNLIIVPSDLANALNITDGVHDYIKIVSSTGANSVNILQNMDVTGNIVVSGLVDGVDVATNDAETKFMYDSAASGLDLKNMTAAESQQLQNIGTVTISTAQWGYLGELDQSVLTTGTPTFAQLTVDQIGLNSGIVTFSGISGANRIAVPNGLTSAFRITNVTGTTDFLVVNTAAVQLEIKQNVDVTGNIVVSGTVDGVDIDMNNVHTEFMYDSAASGLDLKNMTAAESQQLQNINGTTISSGQWVYLGDMDQGVVTTDSVVFAQIAVENFSVAGSTQTFSGISGANKIVIPANYANAFNINDGIASYITLDSTTGLQVVRILQNVDVTGNIVVSGLVDGVDVAQNDTRTEYMYTTLDFANLTTAEAAQLQNIGGTTVSSGQWVYLGDMDQSVTTTDVVEFAALTVDQISVNNSTIVFSGASGSNIVQIPTNAANAFTFNDGVVNFITFDSITGSPFVKLLQNVDVTGNIVVSGLVDGVDVALNSTHTEFMYDSAASGLDLKNMTAAESQQLQNINAVTISNVQWGYLGELDQGVLTTGTPTFAQLTVDQVLIDNSTVTYSGTTGNNIIKMPTSQAEALKINDGVTEFIHMDSAANVIKLFHDTEITGDLSMSGYIQLTDMTAPGNPANGEGRLYKKTGNSDVYWIADAGGVEINLSTPYFDSQSADSTTITSTTSITYVDLSAMTLTTSNTRPLYYVIRFSGEFSSNSKKDSAIIISVNGVDQTSSERRKLLTVRNIDDFDPLNTQFRTPTALGNGVIIKIRWHFAAAKTLYCTARNLIIMGFAQ